MSQTHVADQQSQSQQELIQQLPADFDPLALDNQLCFPLYAVSKEIVRRYGPMLKELDLTYTQYIAMMVLWEQGTVSVTQLGKRLFLDSGTLTPLLKKLESKGLVERARNAEDNRQLDVRITQAGMQLKQKALQVPLRIAGCMPIAPEDAMVLRSLLDKIMKTMQQE